MLPKCTLTIEFTIFELSFISIATFKDKLSYFEFKEIKYTKGIPYAT